MTKAPHAYKSTKTKTSKIGKIIKNAETAKAEVSKAEEVIQSSTANMANTQAKIKKAELIKKQLAAALEKAKPDAQIKYKELLARLEEAIKYHSNSIKSLSQKIRKCNLVIKSEGTVTLQSSNKLHYALHDKKFKIWRALTLQEEKVDFQTLNSEYDENENSLQEELETIVQEGIDRAVISMKNRIKAGDIASIATIAFVNQNAINAIINKYIKKSFEIGKKHAAKEMDVPIPVTPTIKTQLMNLNSAMIAESFATDVDLNAKQKAIDGYSKGVDDSGIVGAIGIIATMRAAKMINSLAGNIVGENINKGRRTVFQANSNMIQGYQRTEILDGVTCDFCLSMDGEEVTADDPMATLDEVHDNCRGLWVPIQVGEPFDVANAGLNPDLEDSFDTVGGAPVVNAFKQLKAPLNDLSRGATEEVAKRMQSRSKN